MADFNKMLGKSLRDKEDKHRYYGRKHNIPTPMKGQHPTGTTSGWNPETKTWEYNVKLDKPKKKTQPKAPPKKRGSYARKGDRVGYRSLGEVNPGTPPTGIVGAGPSVGAMPTPAVPQKRPPSVAKQKTQEQVMAKKIDATNKAAALEADALKFQKKAGLGKPQGQPQGKPPGPPGPPGMPQPQKPPVLSRKGDAIKPQGYRGGGKVYANFCRPASNPDA